MPARRQPVVVISYAREDEPENPAVGEVRWLSFVTDHLRPAKETGAFDIWIDEIAPGADWDEERERKLRACDIFVLLVSPHSLASGVAGKAIAITRERQAKGEGVCFYPLLMTPTPETALEAARDQNLRPGDGRPFSICSGREQTRQMLDAADEIVDVATRMRGSRKWRSRSRRLPPAPLARRTSSTLRPAADRAVAYSPSDQNSLEVWLGEQSPKDIVALAVRTALRGAPLAIRMKSKGPSTRDAAPFLVATSALFRAYALARIAAKYPARANELHAAAQAAATRVAAAPAAAAASAGAGSASAGGLGALAAALTAALAAADAAAPIAPLASPGAALFAAPVAASFSADAAAFVAAVAAFDPAARREIRADALALRKMGADSLADLPLQSHNPPSWAKDDWESLKAALPSDEGWDVWIEWYEERLRGGSRGEAYELVFASAPQEVWDQGPAAANAWIRAHLPR